MKSNQSLARAFSVLEFIADNPGSRLKDVSVACELAAPTALRFLSNLCDLGYLHQSTQTYTVAPRLAALSRGVYTVDTHASIQEVLRILADQCGLTAFYVLNDHDEAVYVQRALPSNASLINTQRIGHRAPLYCTGVGKIFLASWENEAIEDYCRRTEMIGLTHKTITDKNKLQSVISDIRQNGFGIDDEECEIGVKCIAVPVHDVRGATQASISVSGAANAFTEEHLEDYVQLLRHASEQIGGMPVIEK